MVRSDDECVARFTTQRRAWAWVAVPTAVVLLVSIVSTAQGIGTLWLQVWGLVMLGAFVVASAVLCRCPRCHKFLLDKQEYVPDWGSKRCPYCDAQLRERR